jgi:hypothetical protein
MLIVFTWPLAVSTGNFSCILKLHIHFRNLLNVWGLGKGKIEAQDIGKGNQLANREEALYEDGKGENESCQKDTFELFFFFHRRWSFEQISFRTHTVTPDNVHQSRIGYPHLKFMSRIRIDETGKWVVTGSGQFLHFLSEQIAVAAAICSRPSIQLS